MDLATDDKIYTVDMLESLPYDKRAELIDGHIYMMATPSTEHQRIAAGLFRAIDDCIKRTGRDCEVFFAPFAVYINNDEYNHLEPDLTVICDKSKIDEKGCHGAPDFVVEIVSPSSSSRDYVIKLNKYYSSGVKEYWIVDPSSKKTHVYSFSEGLTAVKDYAFDEIIKGTLCPALDVNLSAIVS